jgi:hypothetical protein
MTKENECYAYFTVAGSFDPDEITRRVGVAPTEYSREGDLIPRSDRVRDFSRWILRSRLERTKPLESHVRDVLDQLDTSRTAFKESSAEFEGVMQLVAYFHRDYPGLSFERGLIERMAEYSLSMDCDFYFYYLQSEM